MRLDAWRAGLREATRKKTCEIHCHKSLHVTNTGQKHKWVSTAFQFKGISYPTEKGGGTSYLLIGFIVKSTDIFLQNVFLTR